MSKVVFGCLALLMTLLLLLPSCGSDGDDPAGPGDGNGNGNGTPTDSIAPTVLSADPADGTSDLHLLAGLTFVFSEKIDPANGAISAEPMTPMTARFATTGDTLTIRPFSFWPGDDTLTITFSGLADTAGNELATYSHTIMTGPVDCEHVADELEPNDTLATATLVELDSIYPRRTTCSDDVDFYEFTLTDTAMVTAKATFAYADTVGWQVYFVRDHFYKYATLGTRARTGEEVDFRHSFLPGTYYVEMYSADEETVVVYDLLLETSDPCLDDEYEDNDFEDSPAAIDAGFTENLRGCYLDADWYSLPGTAGQTIIFTVDSGVETGIRRVRIHEPGGDKFSETIRDQALSIDTLAVTGNGDIRVMTMFWEDDVTYDLTITLE